VTSGDSGSAGGGRPHHQARSEPHISYLVFRLERRIRARLDEGLRGHGITATEYMALSELRLRDGLSSAQLARIAFVTPQAMNLVILGLERRKLIGRLADPARRRVLRASLSARGLVELEQCDRSLDQIERTMLADLPAQTSGLLRTTLVSCAQALHSPLSRD
jgi:DNA-binding MarR family transcriptional regulator